MKGKDKRIVTIQLPKTEDREEMSFDVYFAYLKSALEVAKEEHKNKIKFNNQGKIIELDVSTVADIYRLAKNQFKYWASRIPNNLKNYLVDINELKSAVVNTKILYRDEEIDRLMSCILLSTKSNAIIVGDNGVGKTALAYEIARQLKFGECPKDLSNYRFVSLNLKNLLQIKSPTYLKKVIKRILSYVSTNKVIFYIDNLTYMEYDYALYIMLLKIFSSKVKFIASVSTEDYQNFFDQDNLLNKYMNLIYLEEPEIEDIYSMIKEKIFTMQKKYNVKISKNMIDFAIYTGYFLSSSNYSNPQSTLDIINFALADANRTSSKEVLKENILKYYYINFKLEKKTNYNEKKITAYHEVGHFLVSKMSENIKGDKNAFISILPFENTLGLTASYKDYGKQLTVDKEYFIDYIAYFLGGRVGEAVYTQTFSSGAVQDLSYANSIAEDIILSYGLSSRNSEKNKTYTIAGGKYIKDFLLTEQLKNEINGEIVQLMEKAYDRAEKIIKENEDLMKIIVEELLKEGILTGDELEKICKNYREI